MTSVKVKDASPSIYAVLAEELRRSIEEGEYRPGQFLGSEHELARQQGISRVTVRRASELLINEGLLERRAGKGLYVCGSGANARVVHVISSNLRWYPPAMMSRGAQQAGEQKGIQVRVYDACGDLKNMTRDMAMLRQLPSGKVRGAVVTALPGAAFNQVLCELAMRRFPLVLVTQRLYEIDASSVISDNRDGGYKVGQALLKSGHRRIGFIGDLASKGTQDRLEGLRDAIGDAELPFYRSLVVNLDVEGMLLGDWSQRAMAGTRELMTRSAPPTAIFCSCDAVARAAYGVLGEMGLRIPEDVSIVGFGDDPLAQSLVPALTTVREPYEEMGRVAMEMLGKRMDNRYMAVEHVVLPVELVMRESVAPARGRHGTSGIGGTNHA